MPFESLASENRGIDVDSSLFGGKNRWHLKVLVNGKKPEAKGEDEGNPTGDPYRREQVAQQHIEGASQQQWRGVYVTGH